jgi:hypothetical protein
MSETKEASPLAPATISPLYVDTKETVAIGLTDRLEMNWYELMAQLARTMRRDPKLVMNWARYKRIREQSEAKPSTLTPLERDKQTLSYLRRSVFIGAFHLARVHLWLLDTPPELQDETVLWTWMISSPATRGRVCSMVEISIGDTLMYSGQTIRTLHDIQVRRATLQVHIRGFYQQYLSQPSTSRSSPFRSKGIIMRDIAQQPFRFDAPASLKPFDSQEQQMTHLFKMSFDACAYHGSWRDVQWRDGAAQSIFNSCLEQIRYIQPTAGGGGDIDELEDAWIGTDWQQQIAESLNTSTQTIYCLAVALEYAVQNMRKSPRPSYRDMLSILTAERTKFVTRLAFVLASSPKSPQPFIDASTPRGVTEYKPFHNPWMQPTPAPYRASFDLIKVIETRSVEQ